MVGEAVAVGDTVGQGCERQRKTDIHHRHHRSPDSRKGVGSAVIKGEDKSDQQICPKSQTVEENETDVGVRSKTQPRGGSDVKGPYQQCDGVGFTAAVREFLKFEYCEQGKQSGERHKPVGAGEQGADDERHIYYARDRACDYIFHSFNDRAISAYRWQI